MNKLVKKTWITGSLLTALLAADSKPTLAQPTVGPRFENTYYTFNLGTYSNGRYPNAGVLTDLDHDGDLDVVAPKFSYFVTGLTVALNQGNGVYSLPVHYPAANDGLGIVAADFNGDTHQDIAITQTGFNFDGNKVAVYFGSATGKLGSAAYYTVGTGPVGITTSDFNQDGKPDLAVANNGWGLGSTISILLNNGNGTFAAAQTVAAGSAPYSLEAGDLNGDKIPDLAVANEKQKLNILLAGTGGFTRTESSVYPVIAGDGSPSVRLADMDNDADLDVLYSSTGSRIGDYGQIALFTNPGTGVLDSFQSLPLSYFTSGSTDIAVADLDKNGRKDIVAAHGSGRTTDGYQLLLQNTNGSFQSAISRPAGQFTSKVMLGDVDSDQDIDVLTIDKNSMALTVHPNGGAASFPIPTMYQVSGISSFLDTADIDHDGDLDLVASANGQANASVHVMILNNNGNGTLTVGQMVAGGKGGQGAKFRDMNGDGWVDVLYNSSVMEQEYHFHIALNQGNGTFGPVKTHKLYTCGSYDIDAIDLDKDGDLDVAVTEPKGCPGIPNSGRRIFLSLNLGNDSFSIPNIKVVNPRPMAIVVRDFNKDGQPDLATSQASSVDIHMGDGKGDILKEVSYPTDNNPMDLIAADLNGDTVLDLATSNYGMANVSSLSVLLGNANGTFNTARDYESAYSPDLITASGITSGDIDGDGDIDLMLSNWASSDLSVFLNNGSGSYLHRMRYGIYKGLASPIFADFTNDGIADLAATVTLLPSGNDAAVVLLKGQNANPIITVSAPTVKARSTGALQVFPNPTSGQLQVRMHIATPGTGRMRVLDLLGREVLPAQLQPLQPGNHVLSLDLSTLPSGTYIAEFQSEHQREAVRIVLSR